MCYNHLPRMIYDDSYFAEAQKHIELTEEARSMIHLPNKDYNSLPSFQKFAVNTLIFRFLKLQDLVGSKIFRTFLEFNTGIGVK